MLGKFVPRMANSHNDAYFILTTFLQYLSLPHARLHSYFPEKKLLITTNLLMPNPPSCIEKHTSILIQQMVLNSSPTPPKRKSLHNFSTLLATDTRIKWGRHKISRATRQDALDYVSLPHLDKHCRFQPPSLLWNRSITSS